MLFASASFMSGFAQSVIHLSGHARSNAFRVSLNPANNQHRAVRRGYAKYLGSDMFLIEMVHCPRAENYSRHPTRKRPASIGIRENKHLIACAPAEQALELFKH